MSNTKETIGPRGTVAGFRPLIGEERWHRGDFTAKMLDGGWRPLLFGESSSERDLVWLACDWLTLGAQGQVGFCIKNADVGHFHCRTKRPLPQPQVETFEAHGHVWYRHVPGDKCPVENDATVECVLHAEMRGESFVSSIRTANFYAWGDEEDDPLPIHDTVVGYRFPDFPAVHTPLQQQQLDVQHVEKTMQSFQQDTTKQQLLRTYHGWCDVAPDDVAECMEDVRKLLYPTDAERCEAAFEVWFEKSDSFGAVKTTSRMAWNAAWNAAKQEKL